MKAFSRGLALVVLGSVLAGPAVADRRVYAGEEAEALKCAFVIGMTITAAERAGIVSTRDKELAQLYSAMILNRYVSGTESQKLAALKAVGQRRSPARTLEEFRKQGRYCMKRFPLK